ncbi:MAG: MFS transporter, partial [Gammaproteobacteria bacterium]|nr:MFS transporter [Gammaproteobacteria bacterium]
HTFYVLRFLLGVAEAGFFPGIIYYLTYWVPARERARFIGRFMVAIPVSTAVAGPLSGWILGLDGVAGLAGWQWLFLLETLPSIALGILCLRLLADTPASARWLSAPERDWLLAELAAERATAPPTPHSLLRALRAAPVPALCVCYFGSQLAHYGVVFFIAPVYAATGLSSKAVGYAVALPYALAACAMVLWPRHSDRHNERHGHIVLACLVAFAGLLLVAAAPTSPLACLIGFSIGVSGTLAMLPVFWTLPAARLQGAAAAAGIALINATGNLGGFVGPYALGWIRRSTGGFGIGVASVACGLLLAAAIAWGLRPRDLPQARAARA